MANNDHPLESPKIRLWRYLPILIIMGLAVHLLVPQITTLSNSWAVVRGMIWWAVALAIVAQAFSYIGSGYTLHALLDTNQERLPVFEGILITMASYSIGLVTGGWVGELQRRMAGSAVKAATATPQSWPGRFQQCSIMPSWRQ
jgi:uncharacterized membrane protein YbhN (UPF0104 family)